MKRRSLVVRAFEVCLVTCLLASIPCHAAQQPGRREAGTRGSSKRSPQRVARGSRTNGPDRQVARIVNLVSSYRNDRLNTRVHDCWEVMHTIIPHGVRAEIRRGGPNGTPVNAIGWLCYGGQCAGQSILQLDEGGRVTAKKGVHVQGHYGQFLAILAQSRVKPDFGIQLEGGSYSVADLIESEKLGCRTQMELTFTLIALSHYLPSDAVWQNSDGEPWSISRLVSEEIQAPIQTAACGGTHRLMGLSYAVRKRLKQGEPLDGEFARADKFLRDYHRYALSMQNADGSFSTQWFKRREARPDLDRRIQTSGHILEWLVYSLPQEELANPRVVKAVQYLYGTLEKNRRRQWKVGPLGHALHALVLYADRLRAIEEPQVEESPDGDAPALLPALGNQAETELRPIEPPPSATVPVEKQPDRPSVIRAAEKP